MALLKTKKQANYAERLSHTLVDRDTLKLAEWLACGEVEVWWNEQHVLKISQ